MKNVITLEDDKHAAGASISEEVFTNLIVARMNENGYKLIDIFREIKELGYTG